MVQGKLISTPLDLAMRTMDEVYQRPKREWWMDLRPVAHMLAKPGPD